MYISHGSVENKLSNSYIRACCMRSYISYHLFSDVSNRRVSPDLYTAPGKSAIVETNEVTFVLQSLLICVVFSSFVI